MNVQRTLWPGFDPVEHPVVLHRRDANDEIVDLLVFNHPTPEALGVAVKLDAPEPLGAVYHVANPTQDVLGKLADSPTFEFHVELGGVDSFAMVSRERFVLRPHESWFRSLSSRSA